MMKNHSRQILQFLFVFLAFSLSGLFAACGGQSPTAGNQTGSSTAIVSTKTPTVPKTTPTALPATPMPQTQTSCPADLTGRAAVMASMSLGLDQNVVYVSNQPAMNGSPASSQLRRYDVTTGQTTTIYSTTTNQIQQAQVSADGQWILFLATTPEAEQTSFNSPTAMIQMIRLDGQGLQTLYCFEKQNGTITSEQGSTNHLAVSFQWSFDEQSLLFSSDIENSVSWISVLNMKTGDVRAAYGSAHDPDPATTSVITWLDNTYAYIISHQRSDSAAPATIALMNVPGSSAGQGASGTELTNILTDSGTLTTLSIDTSFDNTKLYLATCIPNGAPFQSTITVEPAHGGTQQVIYKPGVTICVENLRVISSTAMLLLVRVDNTYLRTSSTQLWTLKLDGTGQHVIATLPEGGTSLYMLNPFSQAVWSNISRNGAEYALEQDATRTTENLIIGSLDGGNPIQFATGAPTMLSIAGWTTM